jgi:hypothetical protein
VAPALTRADKNRARNIDDITLADGGIEVNSSQQCYTSLHHICVYECFQSQGQTKTQAYAFL